MVPERVLFWNVENARIPMYLIMIIPIALLIYGICLKFKKWKSIGKEENRSDNFGERFKSLLSQVLAQKKVLAEAYPGLMHLLIFWGFVLLFVGTALIALEEDLLGPLFGVNFLHGNFYLFFSFVLDIAGLAALVGTILAMIRRWIIRPSRLETKADDSFVLILIFAILVTGFAIEGARIAVTSPPWAAYSPIGYVTAKIMKGIGLGTKGAHKFFWWFHMLIAFFFIGYLAYSKLFHIVGTSLGAFYRALGPKFKLIPIEDFENAETFGVSNIKEYTWKQIFDFDACIQCGRCQDNCPANLTEKPLNPRKQVLNFREFVNKNWKKWAQSEELPEDGILIENVVGKDEIWACTTCGACEEACPAFVEHIRRMNDIRRYLVMMESDFPQEVQVVFRNMETNSNPWGIGWNERGSWAKDLDVPIFDGSQEYLFYVGCAGSFDDRAKKVSVAFVKILKAAGVSFGILAENEKCCGDSARRIGNEYLFQMLAMENVETMNSLGVKKIVTTCPHCYNILKKEYSDFGGNYEVYHHTELIAKLIAEGRINITKGMSVTATYHDSCYLGRYNDIYDQPRSILSRIPNLNLAEMERRRERSFCCGAGGGRMWMEETLGKRINEERADQALKLNPGLIATACPFCLTMFEDGLKARNKEEEVAVKDIAEVVAEAIGE